MDEGGWTLRLEWCNSIYIQWLRYYSLHLTCVTYLDACTIGSWYRIVQTTGYTIEAEHLAWNLRPRVKSIWLTKQWLQMTYCRWVWSQSIGIVYLWTPLPIYIIFLSNSMSEWNKRFIRPVWPSWCFASDWSNIQFGSTTAKEEENTYIRL